MMTDKKTFMREPAIPTLLQQIEQGSIEVNEENTPFIKINERKVQRINVVGVVVQKELVGTITNLVIDDGTGKIIVRSFEEIKNLSAAKIGTPLRVIGKIRIFNSEKYLSPEIIKFISPEWIKFQHKLLNKFIKKIEPEESFEPKEEKKVSPNPSLEEPTSVEEETITLPFEKIVILIKKLDQGNGALIEEIIEKSTLENTEKIIEKMLEKGEIFQNQPGKIKVL